MPLTNKTELVEDVEVKGSLDCSDHEVVELKTLKEVSSTTGRVTTLDLRTADV